MMEREKREIELEIRSAFRTLDRPQPILHNDLLIDRSPTCPARQTTNLTSFFPPKIPFTSSAAR
jgi:hypothetical protein